MLSNFLKVLCRKNPNENFLRTLFHGPSLDRVPALVHGKQHKKTDVEAYIALKSQERSQCL